MVRLVAEAHRPQVPLDVDVYTLALERCEYIFDRFDHVAVSFSGGKDSTATLNVALEVAHSSPRFRRHLPLRVVHYDEEAIPMETEEYVRRVYERDDLDMEWYCLPVKHRNACARRSPWWYPWAPEARDRWVRDMPPEALTTLEGFSADPPEARLSIPHMNGLLMPARRGNCALLMGIRAAESLVRRRALTKKPSAKREVPYVIKFDEGTSQGNLWKAYPVYDWSAEDVWTAPAVKGWDYNRAYDRLAMAGVGSSSQRCSPAFGEEPLLKLHMFATCFPEVWEKMVDRVPGVGAAVRYARTELYAHVGRPDKPADMSWPEFIRHYVTKYRPVDAAMIAARISDEIRRHYRKTNTPILVKTANPDTGIRWNFLLGLAMRGDFKHRRTATANSSPNDPDLERKVATYVAELRAAIADGSAVHLGHPGPMPDPDTLSRQFLDRVGTVVAD